MERAGYALKFWLAPVDLAEGMYTVKWKDEVLECMVQVGEDEM